MNYVTIVGSGVVSLLLANSLGNLNLKVKLILSNALEIIKKDNRSIALSYSSVSFLNAIDIWKDLKSHVEFIKYIHVSNKNSYGRATIKSVENNLPFLGAIVKMSVLVNILINRLKIFPNVKMTYNYRVKNAINYGKFYKLLLQNNSNLEIDHNKGIIIAADGAFSYIRHIIDINYELYNYKQVALVFDINLKRFHNNWAYERFVENGVIAMLPVSSKKVGCVWVIKEEKLKSILSSGPVPFVEKIQSAFGYRLGKFIKVGPIQKFLLKSVKSCRLHKNNILLFGNAANFLHPAFAQGLNLSIRDIKTLYDVLKCRANQKLNIDMILEKYSELRIADHKSTFTMTHGLMLAFISNNFLIKYLRGMGLQIFQRNTYIKNTFNNIMMNKVTEKPIFKNHREIFKHEI